MASETLTLCNDMIEALRDARIGLCMWSMGTPKIDALIGPMSEEDREAARRARGGSLWDDEGVVSASGGIGSAA